MKPHLIQVGKFWWCGYRGCVGRVARTPERAYAKFDAVRDPLKPHDYGRNGRFLYQVETLPIWRTPYSKRALIRPTNGLAPHL